MIAETLKAYSMMLQQMNKLIDDLPDERLAEQPHGAVNHAAWTMCHLVGTAQMIVTQMGGEAWLDEDWRQRYGGGSQPVNDRAAYPSKQQMIDALADTERRIGERMNALGEEGLAQPPQGERFRERFATVGQLAAYIVAAHTALHVGQVGVWKRVLMAA